MRIAYLFILAILAVQTATAATTYRLVTDTGTITFNNSIITGTNIDCTDVTGAAYDVCAGDGAGGGGGGDYDLNITADSAGHISILTGEVLNYVSGTGISVTTSGNSVTITNTLPESGGGGGTYDLNVSNETDSTPQVAITDGTVFKIVGLTGMVVVLDSTRSQFNLSISETGDIESVTAGTGLTGGGSSGGVTLTLDDTYTRAQYVNRSLWTTIDNYPTACSAGSFIHTIGDVLGCSVVNASTDRNNYTTQIAFSGTTTKTLSLERSNMANLTASFTDIDTDTDTWNTSEEMQDVAGAMVTGNTETGITVTYQDADGTIDFEVSVVDTDTWNTTENMQDAVGGAGADTATIDFEYVDASNQFNMSLKAASVNDEHFNTSDVTISDFTNDASYVTNTYAVAQFVNRTIWITHDNYPTGCSAGNYVNTIGDTLTCAADDDTPDSDSEVPDAITVNTTTTIITSSNINITTANNCLYGGNGGRICFNTTCTYLVSPNGATVVQACNS